MGELKYDQAAEPERIALADCVDSCTEHWLLWTVCILLAFVLLMGNTFSFWLGVLVGLAIPYYIIPHYFGDTCEETL